MASTDTVTSSPIAFAIEQPATKQPLVVVDESAKADAPAPPKDSFIKKAGERLAKIGARPEFEALRRIGGCIGPTLGYLVPAAVMIGGARALVDLHGGSGDAMLTATIIAAAASVGQCAVQGEAGLGNVALYKKEGNPHPRFASFMDIMKFAVVPGLAASWAAGHYMDAAWGVGIGTAVGVLFTGWGFTTMYVRNERLEAKD